MRSQAGGRRLAPLCNEGPRAAAPAAAAAAVVAAAGATATSAADVCGSLCCYCKLALACLGS